MAKQKEQKVTGGAVVAWYIAQAVTVFFIGYAGYSIGKLIEKRETELAAASGSGLTGQAGNLSSI